MVEKAKTIGNENLSKKQSIRKSLFSKKSTPIQTVRRGTI